MGNGNWLPNRTDRRTELYDMVYADLNPNYDLNEEDQVVEYHRLIRTILGVLPRSFRLYIPEKGWIGDDERIVAANGLLYVTVGSNETNMAVTVRVRDDIAPYAEHVDMAQREVLALRHLPNVAKKLWGELAKHWSLYCRTGPWTSTPFMERVE